MVIDEPPEFVAQLAMGFYAAMGESGCRALQWSLRRYPIARIRYMRDERGDDED
jgi:hypothetical protein